MTVTVSVPEKTLWEGSMYECMYVCMYQAL